MMNNMLPQRQKSENAAKSAARASPWIRESTFFTRTRERECVPFRKGSTYMSCIFIMVVSQAVMISGCGGGSGGNAAVPTAGNHGAGEALASGVAVASDRETSADANVDYLSAGAWLSAPDGGAFGLGAFASGGVPFFLVENPEFDLGALLPGGTPFDLGGKPDRIEGSATYEGGALGAHTRAGEVRFFDARIGFEADFDDRTIEGALWGITLQGDEMPDGRIILMEAVFDDVESPFHGVAVGEVSGSEYSGAWSGEFYGEASVMDAEVEEAPGSVTGAFGVSSTDGGAGFEGAFGVYRRR